MVIGHSGCPKVLHDFIYQFHMPLFFIMSGMCLKEDSISNYIVKKIKGIWCPYVKYGVVFLFLHNILFRLNVYSSASAYLDAGTTLYTASDYLTNFSKVIRMTGSEPLLVGFWFLHELFWASIINVIVMKVIRNKYAVLSVLLAITFFLNIFNIRIPIIGISTTTLLSALFFQIGYCFRDLKMSNFIFPVTLLLMVIGINYGADSMHVLNSAQIIPYVLVATICTFAVKKFSTMLVEEWGVVSSTLISIGNKTFTIFVWHVVTFKLVSLLLIQVYDLPIVSLSEFPVIDKYASEGWWIIYSMVGVVIPLSFNILFTKVKKISIA